MKNWQLADMPSQVGKFAIVTGANSGIGFDTALELARAGADVVLACRDSAKGEAAAQRVNAVAPGRAAFVALDLASLASVREFAARMKAEHRALDILVNNAGVMALPERKLTADGFEMQFGVNFLGHFALTSHLLENLLRAPAPRVVQLASIAHRRGQINLDDLQAQRDYKPWPVYEQSKLAMLMFALELQRRADAAGWRLCSVAAHPGVATTELMANGPGIKGPMAMAMRLFGPIFMHSAAAGALPTLLAATGTRVVPGGYYGPQGLQETKGPPGVAKISPQALDRKVADGLWREAERLTGEHFTPGP